MSRNEKAKFTAHTLFDAGFSNEEISDMFRDYGSEYAFDFACAVASDELEEFLLYC